MKAIVYHQYGSPEVLKMTEIEKPVPKDNEILVKIHATTVTVADVRIRSFDVPRSVWIPARIALGIRKPRKTILGVEFSGQIEAIGKNVKRFKKGDKIFAENLRGNGSYAEYSCVAEDTMVALKPDKISYEEAAAIPVGACTALHYLRKANIQSGQKVLVYGASGSVGTYAVQLAKIFGAKVTGVCSTTNLDMVKSIGADEVIDYTKEDFSSRREKYDLIFEAVNKASFTACIKSLKENGIYMNITEPIPGFRMLWTKLTTDKKIILGQNFPQDPEMLSYLGDLVQQGKMKVVIDRKYQMEEIVEAHRYVDKGHKKGNVILKIGSPTVDENVQKKGSKGNLIHTFLPFF